MIRWPKLKNYIIADLSQGQESFSLGHWGDEASNHTPAPDQSSEQPIESAPAMFNEENGPVSARLDSNIEWLKRKFSYPQSSGLIVRRFILGDSSLRGAVVYLENLIDIDHLNRSVLVPLVYSTAPKDAPTNVGLLLENILTESLITATDKLEELVDYILNGYGAVLVDGYESAVMTGIYGWPERDIESPKTEAIVRGSHDGFTEDIETNLTLIRRRLRTPDLMIERKQVGTVSRTGVAIVYLKSIANTELVAEVRKRIDSIEIDFIGDSGSIEQLIEDHPNAIYPSVLSTERPDWATLQIADGYVCMIVDNSPFALIVPAHFPLFLQTVEDTNLRWPYSTFLRIIRMFGFLLSLYLPAIYVGIASYHQEMIPTSLVLAIAGSRESVPVPVTAESFMLESMFELIREAGIRVPGVIGPTLSIVGALILGQAAVQANLVSPLMVIITSATALASFSIPNYNMQFATRMLRYVFILAASIFGLAGVVLASILVVAYQSANKSFGVPALSPLTPHRPSKDTIIREPIKNQKYRPFSIRPRISRTIASHKNRKANTKNQDEGNQ